jgi:cell division protein FtsB
MNTVWRKVHPRHVIWILLVALIGLLAFIGKHYDSRLHAVEDHIETQNGHLQNLVTEQRELKTHVEWIRVELGKENR